MAQKPEKPAKKKSKPPLVSPRTMGLGAIFLVLIGIVAYQYTRPDVPAEEQAIIDAINPGGPNAPPPPPLDEPDPATLPPGSTEEIRPS